MLETKGTANSYKRVTSEIALKAEHAQVEVTIITIKIIQCRFK